MKAPRLRYWVAEEVELPRCIPQLVSAAKARLMLLVQVMRVQAMSRD